MPREPVIFMCELARVEIRAGAVLIEPRKRMEKYTVPLGRICGVLIYRDERIGILLLDDQVIDVPMNRPHKLLVAETIAKAARF